MITFTANMCGDTAANIQDAKDPSTFARTETGTVVRICLEQFEESTTVPNPTVANPSLEEKTWSDTYKSIIGQDLAVWSPLSQFRHLVVQRSPTDILNDTMISFAGLDRPLKELHDTFPRYAHHASHIMGFQTWGLTTTPSPQTFFAIKTIEESHRLSYSFELKQLKGLKQCWTPSPPDWKCDQLLMDETGMARYNVLVSFFLFPFVSFKRRAQISVLFDPG
ncbi:hypothetical protein BU25DRAFT_11558 [Macroventuria anomochaeta]|uniref:Uncharacterized protein n=1 Tax=Macroventuria anomochaeta TaxID=301207 RepID=A0ACB6SHC9_9PLEO|nr:uncharacterized protein BU25DRAFT_11558 [Macroventuria anomochaeta]KAF2633705.1 hypothetical protein BU25DRAFT_11558 [Macroventuria anomochaeta]